MGCRRSGGPADGPIPAVTPSPADVTACVEYGLGMLDGAYACEVAELDVESGDAAGLCCGGSTLLSEVLDAG